jgi:hypothetical protein
VDPNALGEQLLAGDRFRATSPELILNWVDPQTDESWGMTAAGLALTTAPRMKELGVRGIPLAASERGRILAFTEQMAEVGDVHVDKPIGAVKILGAGAAAPATKDTSVKSLSSPGLVYAYPETKKLPLNSAAGVKGAMARFMTINAGTPDRNRAWSRIVEAGKKFSVVVPQSYQNLSASEVAAWLLAEGDGQSELAELPICLYQPPAASVGRCPGWTRNDDGDKDTDVCLMALKGCNGYVPCPDDRLHGAIANQFQDGGNGPDWASSPMPDSTGYYREGVRMTPEEKLAKEKSDAEAAAAAATKDKPAPVENAEQAINAANMAEVNAILATERDARKKAEARADQALAMAEASKKALADRDTADKLTKASAELEALVKSGTITPAEAEVYGTQMAVFAEHPFMLEALKKRPKPVIQMGELGRGGERPQGSNDSSALDTMAKALMSERKQSTDIKAKTFHADYTQALLDVSKQGFQGG